jgi:hypothetical protein
LVLALSVSWFAAARKERFGAEPGGAAVRRHWRIFCYFHSSTICQGRRETLNIYFRHQGGAVLMRDKQRPAYNELLSFTWGGSCEPGEETLVTVALRLDKLEKLDEPAEGSRQGS